MASSVVTGGGERPLKPLTEAQVKERARVKSGVLSDFQYIVAVDTSQSMPTWEVLDRDQFQADPPGITAATRMAPQNRKHPSFINLRGKGNPVVRYIFARVEKGCTKSFVRRELDLGPAKYMKEKMKDGSVGLEAYLQTCNEYIEPLYVNRSFAKARGFYESRALSTRSGQGDLPISAPSGIDDDDEVEFNSLGVPKDVLSRPSGNFYADMSTADLFADDTTLDLDLGPDEPTLNEAVLQTRSGKKTLGASGGKTSEEGGQGGSDEDTTPPPPKDNSGKEGSGGAGGSGGSGGSGRDDKGKKGGGRKGKKPSKDEESDEGEEEEEEEEDDAVEISLHDTTSEESDKSTPAKKRKTSNTPPNPKKARKALPPGTTSRSTPLSVRKPKEPRPGPSTEDSAIALAGPSVPPVRRSETADSGKEMSREDIMAILTSPSAAPRSKMITPTKKDKPALGMKSQERKELKRNIRSKDERDEISQAQNAPIKSKRCGEHCQCVTQNLVEMRDSAANGTEHRILLSMARYHSTVLAMDRICRGRDKEATDSRQRLEDKMEEVLDFMKFLKLERKASQMVNDDSAAVGLPWDTIEDVAEGIDGLVKMQAVQRLLICPAVSSSESRYIADMAKTFFTDDFRGRFYNGLPQGHSKYEKIIYWGREFHTLPKEFMDALHDAIRKKFNVGTADAAKKISQGFNELRIRARARLRDLVLRRRREPEPNPMWELLLRNEMMRQAGVADIIELPAPYDESDVEMKRYAGMYATDLKEQYQRFLDKAGDVNSSEEEEFQNVLAYGKSRGLGGIVQVMDVTVPIKDKELRVGQTPPSPSKGKGKGKGKGKSSLPRPKGKWKEAQTGGKDDQTGEPSGAGNEDSDE